MLRCSSKVLIFQFLFLLIIFFQMSTVAHVPIQKLKKTPKQVSPSISMIMISFQF